MIHRLLHARLIDETQADELRTQIRNLQLGQTTGSIHQADRGLEVTATQSEAHPETPPLQPVPTEPASPPATEAPILATLVDEPNEESSSAPVVTSSRAVSEPPKETAIVPSEPPAPVLSKAEMIQSFLHAHNIRWGELVAGILIVVCSIGLVISLWKPLVDTHRVIPSLIFLAANTAIYAAGLYTLSRWRLRHTSRAVLVIATLLVPLSVVAGLAAAGTGQDAVALNDPITLAAISLAGLVYSVLLWMGGRALTGPYARHVAVSVLAPAALIPFVPALIRSFVAGAGWFLAIGSTGIVFSLVEMVRMRRRETKMGVVTSRSYITAISVSAFATAVAVGYTVFQTIDFGADALLAIAIAIVPTFVAYAGVGRSLMKGARRATQSMVGAVVCTVLIAVCWTIVPAAMRDPKWLWTWAAAFSASGTLVGWRLRQPQWLLLATLPVGIVTVLTSHLWIEGVAWDSIEVWNRFISGSAMLASALVALSTAAVLAVVRSQPRRQWLSYAAGFWCLELIVIAGALALCSDTLLGVAPWWSVTSILAATAAVGTYACTRSRYASPVPSLAIALAWCSVIRPLEFFESPWLGSASEWMVTAVAIAATWSVLSEVAVKIPKWATKEMLASIQLWQTLAIGAAVCGSTVACMTATENWSTSAWTLAGSAVILFMTATRVRSTALLGGAQLASVACAVVIGYGRFHEYLFAGQAWSSGAAIWNWAIASATVAILWMLVRESASLRLRVIRRRLSFLRRETFGADRSIDGVLVLASTGLVAIGAVWSFAALSAQVSDSIRVLADVSWQFPTAALAMTAVATVWVSRHDRLRIQERTSSILQATVALAVVVFASTTASQWLLEEPMQRLVAATTVIAAGAVALQFGGQRRLGRINLALSGDYPSAVAAVVIVVSSVVVLAEGWLDHVVAGEIANRFATFAVVGWWATAAGGLCWFAAKKGSSNAALAAAALVPSATFIAVPALTLSTPMMWIQSAAIAALVWSAVVYTLGRKRDWLSAFTHAMLSSASAAIAVGLISASMVTIRILFDLAIFNFAFGPASVAISVAAALVLLLPLQGRWAIASWPFVLTVLAGQAAWLAFLAGWIPASQAAETLVAIWAAAVVASLVRYRLKAASFDFWHAAILSISIMSIAIGASWLSSVVWMPWIGMVGVVCAGLLAVCVAQDRSAAIDKQVAARVLCWATIVLGLFVIDTFGSGHPWPVKWTIGIGWICGWVIGWRMLTPDRSWKWKGTAISLADVEFSYLMLSAAVVETYYFITAWDGAVTPGTLLWTRVACYVAVAASTVTRASRKVVWMASCGLITAATALGAVYVATRYALPTHQRFMVAALSSGFAVALVAYLLPAVGYAVAACRSVLPTMTRVRASQLNTSHVVVSTLVGGFAAVVCIGMIAAGVDARVCQLTTIAVGMVAIAMVELAQQSNHSVLRHAAISTGLVAVGLLASVDAVDSAHPILTASMQWLVASVVLIPTLLFAVPRLFGERIATDWYPALRRGSFVAAATTVGSLVVMFVTEAIVRTPEGIAGISRPMVIGVAITLGGLAAIAGLIAIVSAKDRGVAWLQLSDGQRRGLILAAQAIGGLTWLHIFLCKTNWAFVGLRSYWPFIVMGLAFVSVGITDWAKRRGDRVLSETLRHTAFYLPLIPVVGFWLSPSFGEYSWAFTGGVIKYDWLLAAGAIYYLGLSVMWKQVVPRIAAIVLGNAALWVVLAQHDNWHFLVHPQAWLIPPAVCVLVVAHLYRDRLDRVTSSAIRYASTLVIYVSSTADMLLQEIGSTIYGPIILILLALAGMLAGVLLRVRPFLYLGATFVFMGVTSMVWHAQRSIDAYWPWWVFGITTGVLLLAGLMALEKNKDKLRNYARTLATWQG